MTVVISMVLLSVKLNHGVLRVSVAVVATAMTVPVLEGEDANKVDHQATDGDEEKTMSVDCGRIQESLQPRESKRMNEER